MFSNVFETLKERGFIEQATNEEKIKDILSNEKVTFYIGFDPTADSLHVGHFLTIMATAHLQRAGHKPIILVGGGTGMIGDPTDRTDMRKMLSKEDVIYNVGKFKKQLSKFIDFENDNAIIVDNSEWLSNLNYIEFLRDYGVHFSVNRMLTADCYKTRLERGLSFLEFNYILMQSYDFLELNRRFNCSLQLGGRDQWSNIIFGVDLIRRIENKEAYGLTLSLLTTSDNKKMGKTQKGALWLDPEKVSPYEFFQYWRNIDDDIVIKCLKLLTFLPMQEINELEKLEGNEINKAKEILAFEITKMVHTEQDAQDALDASRSLFSNGILAGSVPETTFSNLDFKDGINIIELLQKIQLVPSKSEARRLIQQKGIKINDKVIDDINFNVTQDLFSDNYILIQKGKKTFHKITIE